MLFHAICFIFTELSTPVWQKEVRQITYQVVEAMREAEETSTGSIEALVQGITHVTSDRTLRSNLAIFSLPPARFTSAASVVKKSLKARWLGVFFLVNSVLVRYFRPKQKNLELSSMFFCTARPRA